MEQLHPRGIDADGYILSVSNVEIQPQFQDLLVDVCMTLTRSEPLLDGIYIYGSVARGDAVPGVSDLDLTLVLHSPPALQDLEMLESKKRTLESRHNEVTKIDFDIGSCFEVLAADNRMSWGYWLKHRCRLRIPRHLDTQPTIIWTLIPRSLGQAVGAQRRRFALLV